MNVGCRSGVVKMYLARFRFNEVDLSKSFFLLLEIVFKYCTKVRIKLYYVNRAELHSRVQRYITHYVQCGIFIKSD